jgi:hypothetical protein
MLRLRNKRGFYKKLNAAEFISYFYACAKHHFQEHHHDSSDESISLSLNISTGELTEEFGELRNNLENQLNSLLMIDQNSFNRPTINPYYTSHEK